MARWAEWRSEARGAALAGAVAATLLLSPALAGAADQAPPGKQAASTAGASQPGKPAKRVSPYVRFAQQHAQSVNKAPARVKPPSFSVGKPPRVGPRSRQR